MNTMNLLNFLHKSINFYYSIFQSTKENSQINRNIENYLKGCHTDENCALNFKIYTKMHITLTVFYNLLPSSLRIKFILKYVKFKSNSHLDELIKNKKPILIVLPHKGYHIFTAFALQYHFLKNGSMFHSFFDSESKNIFNKIFIDIFKSDPCKIQILHNNTRDLVKSIKILKSGGIVSMFPDVFDFKGAFITTKLFGEVYSAMTGTAFLALKSQATIVPVDCTYSNGKILVEALPPCPFEVTTDVPEDIHLRLLTDHIFRSLQRIIQRNPYEWQYLAQVHQFSHGRYDPADDSLLISRLNNLSFANKEWSTMSQKIYQELQK